MSLKCTLGLVACLTYNGTTVTAQRAVTVLDSCSMVVESQTRPTESMLGLIADQLSGVGFRIHWPGASYSAKRALLVRHCTAYERAFYTKRLWSNPEKWPY